MVPLTELDRLLAREPDSPAGDGPPPLDRAVPVVLFGAGLLGQTILAGLRKVGIEPAAFADDTPGKQGTRIDGVPVLPVTAAAERLGREGAWVVTILNPEHRYLDSRRRLQRLGCGNIRSFVHLGWQYPDVFLPYYPFDLPARIRAHAPKIRALFSLLADDASRRQLLAHLKFRLHLDYTALPLAASDPYFPAGLVLPLPEDVTFVDCGAYTGDTLCRFLDIQQDAFRRVVAVEPDARNFHHLREYVASLGKRIADRIELHPVALGSEPAVVRFNGLGNMSAAVHATGDQEVQMVPLEELVSGTGPTYIKLDIEGAEREALQGCRRLLREAPPLLAVCVYHCPTDLWEIPLLIHSSNPDYRFFLRTEGEDGMDVVCYAVPPHGPRGWRDGGPAQRSASS